MRKILIAATILVASAGMAFAAAPDAVRATLMARGLPCCF